MSDLVAFLNARLDEDEDWATYCIVDACPVCGHWADVAHACTGIRVTPGPGHPARVLREVEAKRRILTAYTEPDEGAEADYTNWDQAIQFVLCELARVYPDHPDNEGWV